MDTTQILLYTVITTLTILMVIIGWQIFQILAEIRLMLTKINIVAQGAVEMSQNFGKSLHNLSGFTQGIKAVLSIIKVVGKKKEKNE